MSKKAIDFLKEADNDLYGLLLSHRAKRKVTDIMENYKNDCVNAISDEDIEKEYDMNNAYTSDDVTYYKGSISGAKWFKQELLNK